MTTLPSFIKAGAAGSEIAESGSKFIKPEEGKVLSIIPLTGIDAPEGEEPNGSNCVISFNQYSIWMDREDLPDGVMSPMFPALGGPSDPGAMLGHKPAFRAMLICMVEGDENHEERILPMGKSVFKQLCDIETMNGESIRGQIIKIKREGSGRSTKYKVVGTSRRVEIEGDPETNLLEHTGPTTRAAIIELLSKAGIWPPEGGDPYAEASKPGKAKTKAKPATAPKAKADDDDKDEWTDDDDFAEA